MTQADSKLYFEKRAAEERAAAEQAGDERAAQPHRELAERYEDVASGGEPLVEVDDAAEGSGLAAEFTILP